VLVVSNIDLTSKIPSINPSKFLASSIKDRTINISDDYRYLKSGYYVSMHAEVLGNEVTPSSQSIIEASRTPILLLKAAKAGIPTLPYLVTDSVLQIISTLGFPVVIFAVNPFSYDGYRIAKNRAALYRAMKSLGMNYKFAVCAQPVRGTMIRCKSIFGESVPPDERLSRISRGVYEIFRIPLCKLHIQLTENEAYLCGFQPLRKEELCPDDIEEICKEIGVVSKQGDCLVG
jgi:hypothetical protein